MSSTWWTLPGPASFVSRAVEQFRHGRSVQLCVPLGASDGLKGACRREVRDGETLRWDTIDVTGARHRPVDVLFECLAPAAQPEVLRDPRSFLAASQAKSTVVWVHGLSSENWPAWRSFLGEFEAATRGVEPIDRTILCLVLEGISAPHAAPIDVCLDSLEWRGVISAVDAWIFAAQLNANRGASPTQTWLRVATIAQLSMWDPALAQVLASLSSKELLSPLDTLKDYANQQRWSQRGVEARWEDGAIDTWEGADTVHSACLATRAGDRGLSKRIWKGQAQALMPFLEEQRTALAADLAPHLALPFTPKGADSPIVDLHDLELGHLQTLVYGKPVGIGVWSKLDCLRKLRNHLAHLELAPAELLFHRCLSSFFLPD